MVLHNRCIIMIYLRNQIAINENIFKIFLDRDFNIFYVKR